MKFVLSHARALLLGVALIVLTNAVVLAGVAYNRSGEPESVLQLTERELKIRAWNWPENENSSIDLYIHWRVAEGEPDLDDPYSRAWDRALDWLKPEQMRELGFKVDGDLESKEGAERIRRQPSRRAWVVLEFDGPAYQEALERARIRLAHATSRTAANPGEGEFEERLRSARREMEHEENRATRLFAIDVGPDADVLRARYPDRKRHAIVQGRLRMTITGSEGRKRLTVQLADIDADAVRVPHAYRSHIEPYVKTQQNYSDDHDPRFSATVKFGQRYEPWIEDLALLK